MPDKYKEIISHNLCVGNDDANTTLKNYQSPVSPERTVGGTVDMIMTPTATVPVWS